MHNVKRRVAALLSIGILALVTACTLVQPATPTERLFGAETVYASVVNSAAIAVEAELLSADQIETFDTGRQLVRMALDNATELIKSGDQVNAVIALNEAAVLLDELNDILLEARTDE